MARAIWKGAISFGLLNIPIEVFSAKDEKKISFHMLDKRDNSMIGYKQYNKSTGKDITRTNIVKGYEYEPHQFVVLEEKDFIKANPKATQTIDIEDFVQLEDLDFLLFDHPYYLTPAKNGEKGYVLLRKVLEETKKVAIAKVVMHNSQHLVCVIPKGEYLILEVLRFAHEVQKVGKAEFLDKAQLAKVKVSAKELAVAQKLVEDMTAKWKPEQYKDTYQDELRKYIKAKIKKGETKESEPLEKEERTNTNVVDLMPLLQKSLAAKHKKTKTRAKIRKSASHERHA
ncbi:MAG: Ku protein [Bdellovibrio sp.]|nr:Ku protein [Bdellovibrio sp.]